MLKFDHRWLESTPTSRVITRCTQDIRALDGPIPETFKVLVDLTGGMVVRLGAVVLYSPSFVFPGVLMAAIGGYAGNIYLQAQLSVKREMRFVEIVQEFESICADCEELQ